MKKDKITGEMVEIRTKKFTTTKEIMDFIQDTLDSYRAWVFREMGQQISENKALEFIMEEIRQNHQGEFNIIKQV